LFTRNSSRHRRSSFKKYFSRRFKT